jgi:hypothetical protein
MQMLKPQRRLRLLKRAYEDIGPKSPQQVEEYALWHYAYERDPKESERLFVEAAAMEPSTRYLYQLAAFRASEYQEAAARLILEEVLRLDPLFAPAWALLGVVLEKGPESLCAYQRAAELAPENDQFRHAAAYALILSGSPQTALPLLLQLQQGYPTTCMSYNLAIAYLHLDQKESSRQVLLHLNPDPRELEPDTENIADALALSGDPRAALKLENLNQLCPLQLGGVASALAENDPERFLAWVEIRIQNQLEYIETIKAKNDPEYAEWLAMNEAEWAALVELRVGPRISMIPAPCRPKTCKLLDCPLHPPSTTWNES